MAIKKSKTINQQNDKRYLSKVLLVLILLSISSILFGCQVSEKDKWLATYKDEMKTRETNVEFYLLDYLEKKYHEKFISHGLISGSWTWDMPAKSQAMLVFHMESEKTGIHIKTAYSGAYIHPESKVSINSYRWLVDDDYWIEKLAYDFSIKEKPYIDKQFLGNKPRVNVFFRLDEPPFSYEFFREQVVLDPKYLDVDYYLKEEKDKLSEYNLSMDYFRNVTEENRIETLQDIYDFILYTRSQGFESCSLDISIFDEKIKDSAEYKEYLLNDDGISLEMYLGLAGLKKTKVIVDTSVMDKINSIEDLEKYHVMNITKEKVDK